MSYWKTSRWNYSYIYTKHMPKSLSASSSMLSSVGCPTDWKLFQCHWDIDFHCFFLCADFPDSLPAIQDLRHIFETYDLKAHMVRSVKSSLEKKLLHPGVNTIDILTGYVAAIKTIRALDSSGLLLDAITDPIKKYMRNRTDTVRCVVTALTDDGPTDLAEELAASEAYVDDMSGSSDQLSNWETWEPEPIDANIGESSAGILLHRNILIPSIWIFSDTVHHFANSRHHFNGHRYLWIERGVC